MILPLLSLVITIGCYVAMKKLYKKWSYIVLSPLLICPIALIAFLVFSRIPYETFHKGTHVLSDLLAPATVAFAIPLYKNFETFKKYLFELTSSVLAGTCVAMGSTFALAEFFHFSPSLVDSLVPRSVTTPIAIDISKTLGGDPTICAVFVLLTGIIGMCIGPSLIRFFSFRSAIARGVLFGTAAHGGGTSKAFEFGSLEGTFSSISMIVAAILSLVLAPIVIPLLEKIV